LAGHKVFHQPATMRFGAVPNHQQLLFDVTLTTRGAFAVPRLLGFSSILAQSRSSTR
jgi:hypothetical protein